MKKIILILFNISIWFACNKSFAENNLSYVGEWQSKEIYLLILSDGTVSYKFLKNGGTTSIKAKPKEFEVDELTVGIAFLKTTFDVSKPPYQEGDNWYMVVDGVKLIKSVKST